MLGTTLWNIATLVALVVTSVAPGPAAADVSDEPPQDVRATAMGADKIHVSWLDPVTVGSTAWFEYKVQWKSGTQEYSETRQAVTTGIDEDIVELAVLFGYTTLRYDLFYRIGGLQTGVKYTVRVIRTGGNGASEPSYEATATPLIPDEILRVTVEKLVEEYGDDSPWIQHTWDYLHDLDVPLDVGEVGSGISGSYDDHCYGPDTGSPLYRCVARLIQIDDPLMGDLILHEFAHAYSLDVDILADHPDKAEGMAIAFIYLGTFVDEPNNACNRIEYLADLMTIWEMGIDEANPEYWIECGLPQVTDEVLNVIDSALDGERPAWFYDTYSESGVLDLERLWADIQQFEPRTTPYHVEEQRAVVYHLRNSFGGYCNEANATASMFGDGPTRNPWRDGGCVPTAPVTGTTIADDGDVSVAWTAPTDDGGAPIEGYKIQWRWGGQPYDESRQAVITDPSTRRHRLAGLFPGVRYQVQVLAYNTNGDGTPSNQLAVLATANPADSPWSRIWPGWLIG
ncbi:MAG: fibronectin type III domain-containing protein [bacterium]|nr:fibronectin type III domain-containing protein [bacterium]